MRSIYKWKAESQVFRVSNSKDQYKIIQTEGKIQWEDNGE